MNLSDPNQPNTTQDNAATSNADPKAVPAMPPPPPGYFPGPYSQPAPAKSRGGIFSRIAASLVTSLLVLSIMLNIYLGAWLSSIVSGPSESAYAQGDRKHRIVILPVDGIIDQGTADFIHRAMKVLKDDPPKAIVLRVNSAGGGMAASDRIWYELTQFKQEHKIPIVTSFGTVAASGGYYIAAPTDYIIAEPTSITGSIGVIAQMFTVQELLNKIGVTPEIITATQAIKKDMLSPMRDWTEDDRNALRSILDHAYDRFVDIVVQGRKTLTVEQVKQLATGEVYTTQQALDNQLVDQQGYLDAAITKAVELAGIDPDTKPMVTLMSPPRGLGLLGGVHSALPGVESFNSTRIRQWIAELYTPRIEYRWSR